jgi:hypothetical protein
MTSPTPAATSARQLLRHAVATIAYRGGKTLRGAPPEFASYNASVDGRTPAQILAHLGDLFDWALSIARGDQKWKNSEPLAWELETERFFAALKAFDNLLATDQSLAVAPERLFQGPVADALTHVGQIAMLRRMAGCPMRGENYYQAEIKTGRVGSDQAAPKQEFG